MDIAAIQQQADAAFLALEKVIPPDNLKTQKQFAIAKQIINASQQVAASFSPKRKMPRFIRQKKAITL